MRSVVAVGLLAATACASEPLEFADWTIPVPEGTRIVEYGPVPLEGRSEEIELVVDLVLGGETEDPDQAFYRLGDIAVAADGQVFVHEWGSHRIQVFDSDGAYSRTIGRGGQGPGEIDRGGEIAIVADRLVRSGDSRLSVWTLGGEHVVDSAADVTPSLTPIKRLEAGWLLAGYSERNDDGTNTEIFASVSLDAEIGQVFARFTGPRRLQTIFSDRGFTIVDLPGPTPVFATSRDGIVYLTGADEYQVLALDARGNVLWALRTAWPRTAVTEDDMERAVARRVDDTPARSLNVEWPTLNPALATLMGTHGGRALSVDGHGHLYVFPFAREPVDGRYPVDVFGPDGQRLFAGMISVSGWSDALGDFVYVFGENEATEETEAVRYRLVEPFE